jgi:DHA1 family tetracycline resistance protein-like MFS transporter
MYRIACASVGIFGGIVGGFGTRIPFFVAGGLAFANALFGAFALPESLPESSRRLFQWARANPAGTLIHLKKYPMIYALAAVNFLWQLAHQVLPSTWTFYTMLKFNWNQNDVGYSLAFVGLCMTIVQGGLSGPIIKKLGERGAAIGGLLIGAIGFFGYALSPSPWIIYIFAAISSLSGLTYPSLNALMSGQVPATSQGELQGGNSSLISITSILGPLLMTQTFHMFATGPGIVFPGAPFALAGILAIGALMVLFISLARIARAPGPQG